MALLPKASGGENESPRESRLAYLLLPTTAVVSVIAVTAAVLGAPNEFRIPLIIGGAIAAIVLWIAVGAAVHYRGNALHAQFMAERAVATADARIADADRMVVGHTAAAVSYAQDAKDSDSRRISAMAGFAAAAGRMQAMATSMLAELREMEHRHGDPRVLADLLQLDHRTAQAGRLADSIAVLSGARSGRRWAKPIAMESILRGAMGRVAGYQRVRLRAVADIAIAGHAAEGVMHALAELIDNACKFSPPTTEVHVYAAEVPAGVVVTIEDSGLVMSDSALRRAQATVTSSNRSGRARRAAADLSSLTGTRVGLSVVGHLAGKHGLTVSFRPSAIGGTAVVVVIPRDVTTGVERPQPTTPTGTLAAATALESSSAHSRPLVTEKPLTIGHSPLPKRHRGTTLAAAHPKGLSEAGSSAITAPRASSDAMGAFQRAMGSRRPADRPPTPTESSAVENDR